MLHADHEQNASTSTVRIAGSSQARFSLHWSPYDRVGVVNAVS